MSANSHITVLNPQNKPLNPDPSIPLKDSITFIGKKRGRNNTSRSSPEAFHGNLCNICLEYDKYTLNKCIICQQCKAVCHMNCYSLLYPSKDSGVPADFTCFRCQRLNESLIDIQSQRCIVCSEYKGILLQETLSKEWIHLYCKVMIREINDDSGSSHEIKQWRIKSMCKGCKCKGEERNLLIKCVNTKCKECYHIGCALGKRLLFGINYQCDFYAIKRDDYDKLNLPFYCDKHNKGLRNAYDEYTSQLDALLMIEEDMDDCKEDKEDCKEDIPLIDNKKEDRKTIIEKEEKDKDKEEKVEEIEEVKEEKDKEDEKVEEVEEVKVEEIEEVKEDKEKEKVEEKTEELKESNEVVPEKQHKNSFDQDSLFWVLNLKTNHDDFFSHEFM